MVPGFDAFPDLAVQTAKVLGVVARLGPGHDVPTPDLDREMVAALDPQRIADRMRILVEAVG